MVERVKRLLGIPPPPLTRAEQESVLVHLKIDAASTMQRLERELMPRVEQMRTLLRPHLLAVPKRAPPLSMVQGLRAAEAIVKAAETQLVQMQLGIIMIEQAHALQDGVSVMQDTSRVLDATRATLPKDMDAFIDDFRTQVETVRTMQQTLTDATRDMNFELTAGDHAVDSFDGRVGLSQDEEARLLQDIDALPAAPVPSAPSAPQIATAQTDPDILAKRRRALLTS